MCDGRGLARMWSEPMARQEEKQLASTILPGRIREEHMPRLA
jgi:hypothetical protein